VRNVARIKLGYYPLPQEEGKRLRNLLDFSGGTASVVDPCVGTGAALRQLTEGVEAERHGVELDANRAADAAASGITTIQGDLFNTIAKVESFSFLYLNPPYDSEIGSMDNRRMEFLFLEHTYRWLVEGGVLLMVVPQARLDSSISLLDPESERFDQVALFGVRKRMRGQDYSRNRAALHEMVWRRDMPTLQGNETPYRVPARPPHGLSIVACLSIRLRTLLSTPRPGNKLKLSYSRRKRWQVVDRLHHCMPVTSAFSARPDCSTVSLDRARSGTSHAGVR
jgi:hypothetical protein